MTGESMRRLHKVRKMRAKKADATRSQDAKRQAKQRRKA